MTSVTTTIIQNNQTVTYLEDGDYSNAIGSSVAALAGLRMSSGLVLGENSPPKIPSGGNGGVDQCMLLKELFGDDDEMKYNTAETFIYTHSIRVPPTTIATDPTILGPILIFNAALAHHLAAEASGSSIQDLQRAKRLYEVAYGSQPAEQNSSTLFRFAVINNISVIEEQLGNTELSQHYFHHLMSILMLFVDQERTLILRHLRGFLVNVRGATSGSKEAARAA